MQGRHLRNGGDRDEELRAGTRFKQLLSPLWSISFSECSATQEFSNRTHQWYLQYAFLAQSCIYLHVPRVNHEKQVHVLIEHDCFSRSLILWNVVVKKISWYFWVLFLQISQRCERFWLRSLRNSNLQLLTQRKNLRFLVRLVWCKPRGKTWGKNWGRNAEKHLWAEVCGKKLLGFHDRSTNRLSKKSFDSKKFSDIANSGLELASFSEVLPNHHGQTVRHLATVETLDGTVVLKQLNLKIKAV